MSRKNEEKKLEEMDQEIVQYAALTQAVERETQTRVLNQNDEEMKGLETKKSEVKEKLEELDKTYKRKMAEYQESQNQINGIEDFDDQLKILDTNIQFQQQTLDNKTAHFLLLKKQITDKEKTEDFRKLPNYEKAHNLDETNISTLLIQLDIEEPPEAFYMKEEEKYKQQFTEN